jgi:hypothetical protein
MRTGGSLFLPFFGLAMARRLRYHWTREEEQLQWTTTRSRNQLRGTWRFGRRWPARRRSSERCPRPSGAGSPVWEIAQELGISEQAVWRTLDGVIAIVSGREMAQVETGGLGSDTDPGITGGYGDTGFGALDTEPIPDNTEPVED